MQRYVKLGNHSRSFDVHQNWVTLDEIVKMSCDSRLYIYLVYIYIHASSCGASGVRNLY